MTIFHCYCTNLYLQYSTDRNGIKQARQHLKSAIYLQPTILFNRTIQKSAIKLLLKQALPMNIANHLMKLVRKSSTANNLTSQPHN